MMAVLGTFSNIADRSTARSSPHPSARRAQSAAVGVIPDVIRRTALDSSADWPAGSALALAPRETLSIVVRPSQPVQFSGERPFRQGGQGQPDRRSGQVYDRVA